MRVACIIMAMAIGLPISAQAPTAQPITELVKLKWKAYVGHTTYRTNILHYGNRIIVGSNGHHYKDYALDSDNGVYVLDALSGKQIQHLAHESLGDMDVNGVVADGSRIYFGSDNDEFHCYLLSGERIWTVPVSGDVEVIPVLSDVDKDGLKDIIFATEGGEVGALSAIDGKQLWSFKIKGFSGWKKTNSRFVFKVGDWFRNGNGFMAAPQLADLNKDGSLDVIAMARDGNLYALDGLTGKRIWQVAHAGYLSQPPILFDLKGETRIGFFSEGIEAEGWRSRWVCVDRMGKTVFRTEPIGGTHEGLQPAVYGKEAVFASWDSVFTINLYSGALRKGKTNQTKTNYYGSATTAQPLLLVLMGLGSPQLILMGQDGNVTMMTWSSLVRLREYKLPHGCEATPLLTDVDCDGKMELLISTYDGYLYCFTTGLSEKAVAWAAR